MAPIKALVRSHVKGSVLLSNVGAEVSFQLPNDASPSFKDMLLEMDKRKEELGISRWAEKFLLLSSWTCNAAVQCGGLLLLMA